MSNITLVRQPGAEMADSDREAARRVIFGIVDGLGDSGRRQWRRFWNGLFRMEAGEMVSIKTHKARSGPFHRRHMVIETAVFEAQEKFQSFEQFRNWLKVGSAFCDWVAGPKGGVIPVPKSIAFDKLEDDEMRQVHDNMIEFLRTEHAGRALWKHLSSEAQTEMIESILKGFGE